MLLKTDASFLTKAMMSFEQTIHHKPPEKKSG
jgi:hypothetical protein